MSLFNLLITLTLLTCSANAQNAEDSSIHQALKKPLIRRTWVFSYLSWTEMVEFESSTTTDRGFANFYGPSLGYEYEIYSKGKTGFAFQGEVLSGVSNVGGSQTNLTYQQADKNFLGVMAQARYAYRLNNGLTASIGPIAIYRNASFPEVNGVKARVGNPANLGVIGAFNARLSKNYELRQSFGTLGIKASAIWSIAIGYKY